MKRALFPLALLVGVLSGCSAVTSTLNLFNTDPMIDVGRDENGNTILLDTPKNWDFSVFIMELDVANEVAGKRPPGGVKTWDDHWHSILHALKEGQENPQRYRTYIIHRRWQMGLPPLTEEK